MKRLICILLCLAMFLCGCAATVDTPQVQIEMDIAQVAKADGNIHYYFMSSDGAVIDGNDKYHTKWGDCCLIAFPDGKVMLIDTGMKSFYPILKEKLQSLNVKKIDYMVFSHPHNDHAGGLWTTFFEDFEIAHIYHNGEKNPNWDKSSHSTTISSMSTQHV